MGELEQFLGLTPNSARGQWQQIALRLVMPRQVPFVPVETILALALFQIVKPNRYGGNNIHQAPAEVHALGRACKRTASSFLAKMQNLEGTREHGQAVEPLLFAALYDDAYELARLYRIVIIAAREAGFDSSNVPDFLGLVDGSAHVAPVLRQLGLLPTFPEATVARIVTGYGLNSNDALRLLRARAIAAESRFDRDAMDAWSWKCGLCGLAPRTVPAAQLLVTTRFKNRPHASDDEFMNLDNVIVACRAHGDALATGLLGVTPERRVLISPSLAADVAEESSVARLFGPGVLLREVAQAPRLGREFVGWHLDRWFA